MSERLPDLLGPGLRAVFCGTAAGAASARRRAYYAGSGNKFWRTLHDVGLTPRRFAPEEFPELLALRIGLTDLCKIGAGSDREVARHGFDVARLRRQIETHQPRVLAFNGKKAGQVAIDPGVDYGPQPDRWGTTALWVLPSTSGAASGHWDIGPWDDLGRSLD